MSICRECKTDGVLYKNVNSTYSVSFQKKSDEENLSKSENGKKSKKSMANGKPGRKRDVIDSLEDDEDKVRHSCLCNVGNNIY